MLAGHLGSRLARRLSELSRLAWAVVGFAESTVAIPWLAGSNRGDVVPPAWPRQGETGGNDQGCDRNECKDFQWIDDHRRERRRGQAGNGWSDEPGRRFAGCKPDSGASGCLGPPSIEQAGCYGKRFREVSSGQRYQSGARAGES